MFHSLSTKLTMQDDANKQQYNAKEMKTWAGLLIH